MKFWCYFFFLIVQGSALAVCNNTPIKRRVLINWCGDCNKEEFKVSMQQAQENLGRGAAKVYSFQGPHSDDAKFLRATPESLKETLNEIKADRDLWLKNNPGQDPSSYEVDFFVTNHGTVYVDEKGASVDFAITGDPSLNKNLDFNDLSAMGSILGKMNVRLKGVFGQCYGGTSRNDLFYAYEKAGGTCGCISALSAPGNASSDLRKDGAIAWEATIAKLSGSENLSLLEAGWRALNGVHLGAYSSKSESVYNAGLSQSEALVFAYFASNQRIKNNSRATHESIEESAIKLLAEAGRSNRNMTHILPIIEKSRAARQKTAAALLGRRFGEADFIKYLDEIKISSPSIYSYHAQWIAKRNEIDSKIEESNKEIEVPQLEYNSLVQHYPETTYVYSEAGRLAAIKRRDQLGLKIDELHKQLMALYDQSEKFYRQSKERYLSTETPLVKSVLVRDDLEEAFARTAPIELVNKFLSLRSCELEQLGPGNQLAVPLNNFTTRKKH
ncbi:MAG: hypothetical protein KA116_07085 [Proteobacteria bacterium]|nr:hypothetical protein [Pseudomonadota bacterium]